MATQRRRSPEPPSSTDLALSTSRVVTEKREDGEEEDDDENYQPGSVGLEKFLGERGEGLGESMRASTVACS